MCVLTSRRDSLTNRFEILNGFREQLGGDFHLLQTLHAVGTEQSPHPPVAEIHQSLPVVQYQRQVADRTLFILSPPKVKVLTRVHVVFTFEEGVVGVDFRPKRPAIGVVAGAAVVGATAGGAFVLPEGVEGEPLFALVAPLLLVVEESFPTHAILP